MEASRCDSEGWPEIVGRLGGEAALAASARQHKALLRRRAVGSAGDLLRLALIYGPGGHSLRTAAALADIAGIADLSDVALMKRIAGSADWLAALCAERLAAIAAQGGPSLRLRILDGSTITAPDNSRYRLHACYDPHIGCLCDLELTTGAEGERLDRLPPRPGDLLIADRGYPSPAALARAIAAEAEVLVRISWKSLHLRDMAGRPLDWQALFAAAKSGPLDIAVTLARPRRRSAPLAMRLVILAKPAEAQAAARRKARRTSAKNQHRIDQRTLAAADHLILITSLDQDTFPPTRLKDLYAVRWQIELAFKRLKSILDLASLPAKNPELARAWLYAHLLLALIIDDIRTHPGAFPP